MFQTSVDVLVVGCGPTGLALANALGMQGVSVLLVEQDPGVAQVPRAVSVDNEAMRFMQRIGLRTEAEAVTLPGTGTKYYGARGQLLAYARGPAHCRFGFPIKNPIDHPSFQRTLLDGARRFPCVQLRHETRFLSMTQDSGRVFAEIENSAGRQTVESRYLVGCDGGRSTVRSAIGQEPMAGSAFAERWLVVDTINDHHDERYAMHYGDPKRPRVVIVGNESRCRYEFLIHKHEDPGDGEIVDLTHQLMSQYRTLDEGDIVRATIYQFYALVARQWSEGRVFLAGDAAHMMPPFAGQGLNSGLRDASNLGWKLGAVLVGSAGKELLTTYEAERRPHVLATVDLSVRLGSLMMTLSRVRAVLRDTVFAVGARLPGFRRFFAELRFRPEADYSSGFAVGGGDSRVGRQLRQPRVLTSDGSVVGLDDVLGPGFALLGLDVDPIDMALLSAPLWARLDATRATVALGDRLPARGASAAVADLDGLLAEQLRGLEGRVVLVRPDRFIAGTFALRDEATFAAEVGIRLGAPQTTAFEKAAAI
jgi:3-(3-hydroxy-phenyl)propionate hydroxylase